MLFNSDETFRWASTFSSLRTQYAQISYPSPLDLFRDFSLAPEFLALVNRLRSNLTTGNARDTFRTASSRLPLGNCTEEAEEKIRSLHSTLKERLLLSTG